MKHIARPSCTQWNIDHGWVSVSPSLFFNGEGKPRDVPWYDGRDPVPPAVRSRGYDSDDSSVTGGRCVPCVVGEYGRITHVMLVMDPRHGDWKYPGGKREEGETLLQNTIRELEGTPSHGR